MAHNAWQVAGAMPWLRLQLRESRYWSWKPQQEALIARELQPVPGTGLADIDLGKLNAFIHLQIRNQGPLPVPPAHRA